MSLQEPSTPRSTPAAVSLRPLAQADLDRLKPLWLGLHDHHQSIAPALAPFVSDDVSWAARKALYAHSLDRGGFAVVATLHDTLIGYAVSAPEATHWDATFASAETLTELVTLCVHPDWRGRGVGGVLLDAVDARAASRGPHEAMLGVLPQNERAIALYRRRGFVPAWLLLTRFGRPPPPALATGAPTIEPVPASEIDSLRDLWLALHQHHQDVAPHLAPFVSAETSWAVMRRLLGVAVAEGGLWRAGSRERPLGFVRFGLGETTVLADTWRTGERVGEVHVLVVAEDQRGRGIGSALLDRAEQELARRGAQDQMISVIEPNAAAIRLYERRGYRPAWLNMTRFAGRADREPRSTQAEKPPGISPYSAG